MEYNTKEKKTESTQNTPTFVNPHDPFFASGEMPQTPGSSGQSKIQQNVKAFLAERANKKLTLS